MEYGKCISCNYDLKDGSKRSVAEVIKDGTIAYICNDTHCERSAHDYYWTIRSYSGKQTINKPGEKGIFIIE